MAEGLRRSLRIFANAWRVTFAASAAEAFAVADHVDALVCDASLPEVELLLGGFKDRAPRVARAVLAGVDVTPEALARVQALSPAKRALILPFE